MSVLDARLKGLQKRYDDLLAGYLELDGRVTLLATQLAEQNLRVLFLLHKSRWLVKRRAGIVIGGEPELLTRTALECYEADRDAFLAELEQELQRHGQDPPVGEESGADGCPQDPSAGTGSPAEAPPAAARRLTLA